MECNPNEPIDTVCSDTLGQTIYFGLTKREHMAIEFTKAMLSNNNGVYNFKSEDNEIKFCSTIAIKTADELIKQLNKTKTN